MCRQGERLSPSVFPFNPPIGTREELVLIKIHGKLCQGCKIPLEEEGSKRMKCPRCWAYEAYAYEARKGWKEFLLGCLLLIPMKCQHCYHKFRVFWPFTIGQQMTPPSLRVTGVPSSRETHHTPIVAVEPRESELSHHGVAEVRRRSRAA